MACFDRSRFKGAHRFRNPAVQDSISGFALILRIRHYALRIRGLLSAFWKTPKCGDFLENPTTPQVRGGGRQATRTSGPVVSNDWASWVVWLLFLPVFGGFRGLLGRGKGVGVSGGACGCRLGSLGRYGVIVSHSGHLPFTLFAMLSSRWRHHAIFVPHREHI